jgi:hypothetical protein
MLFQQVIVSLLFEPPDVPVAFVLLSTLLFMFFLVSTSLKFLLWHPIVVNIHSYTDVTTGFSIPAVVGISCCFSFLVLLQSLLLMCSYCCCFIPGVHAMARVPAVASFPTAVKVSSRTCASNVPYSPC